MLRSTALSLYHWIYQPVLALWLVINTFVLAIIVMLMSLVDSNGNASHYVGKLWSRMNLWTGLVDVDIRGLEHLDPGQPYVVMANHQSLVDVWTLIGYMPLQLRWVIKAELRKVPMFGFGCERMGQIFVQRGNSERARRSLEAAGRRIRSGASVVFFPEGTRSTDGRLLRFKKGGFVVALSAGVPILPVTLNGGLRVLPKHRFRANPGSMQIIIHTPIRVDTYGEAGRAQLIADVRKAIEQGLRLDEP